MRISKIAIVALGAALIGACQAKSPEAADDTNVENAAESIVNATDVNAADMNAAMNADTNAADMNAVEMDSVPRSRPTQASPSDSDVPAPRGHRPSR